MAAIIVISVDVSGTGTLAQEFEQHKRTAGRHGKAEQQRDRALCCLRRQGGEAEHGQADMADAGIGEADTQVALGQHADGTVEDSNGAQPGEQPMQVKRSLRRQRDRKADQPEGADLESNEQRRERTGGTASANSIMRRSNSG